jgi:hypothetical protein
MSVCGIADEREDEKAKEEKEGGSWGGDRGIYRFGFMVDEVR